MVSPHRHEGGPPRSASLSAGTAQPPRGWFNFSGVTAFLFTTRSIFVQLQLTVMSATFSLMPHLGAVASCSWKGESLLNGLRFLGPLILFAI